MNEIEKLRNEEKEIDLKISQLKNEIKLLRDKKWPLQRLIKKLEKLFFEIEKRNE